MANQGETSLRLLGSQSALIQGNQQTRARELLNKVVFPISTQVHAPDHTVPRFIPRPDKLWTSEKMPAGIIEPDIPAGVYKIATTAGCSLLERSKNNGVIPRHQHVKCADVEDPGGPWAEGPCGTLFGYNIWGIALIE